MRVGGVGFPPRGGVPGTKIGSGGGDGSTMVGVLAAEVEAGVAAGVVAVDAAAAVAAADATGVAAAAVVGAAGVGEATGVAIGAAAALAALATSARAAAASAAFFSAFFAFCRRWDSHVFTCLDVRPICAPISVRLASLGN
jgi:hypothetical protein